MSEITMKLDMTEAQIAEACADWARKQVPGWRPGTATLHVAERRVGPREDLCGHAVTAKVTMTQGRPVRPEGKL